MHGARKSHECIKNPQCMELFIAFPHFLIVSLLSVDCYNVGKMELGQNVLFTATKSKQPKVTRSVCLSLLISSALFQHYGQCCRL